MTNFIPFAALVFLPYGKLEQAVVRFENGFGASILRGAILYGEKEKELCQVAVLYNNRQYNRSPITFGHPNGVLDRCTEADVEEALERIAALVTINGTPMFEEGESHA